MGIGSRAIKIYWVNESNESLPPYFILPDEVEQDEITEFIEVLFGEKIDGWKPFPPQFIPEWAIDRLVNYFNERTFVELTESPENSEFSEDFKQEWLRRNGSDDWFNNLWDDDEDDKDIPIDIRPYDTNELDEIISVEDWMPVEFRDRAFYAHPVFIATLSKLNPDKDAWNKTYAAVILGTNADSARLGLTRQKTKSTLAETTWRYGYRSFQGEQKQLNNNRNLIWLEKRTYFKNWAEGIGTIANEWWIKNSQQLRAAVNYTSKISKIGHSGKSELALAEFWKNFIPPSNCHEAAKQFVAQQNALATRRNPAAKIAKVAADLNVDELSRKHSSLGQKAIDKILGESSTVSKVAKMPLKAHDKITKVGGDAIRAIPLRRNIRKKASSMNIMMVNLDPIESKLIEEIIMSDHATDGNGLAGYIYPSMQHKQIVKWLPKYQKAMKSLEKKGVAYFGRDPEIEKEYPGIRWAGLEDDFQEETGEGYDYDTEAPRSSGGYTVRNLVFATGDYYTQNNWEIDTWDGLRVAKKTMNFEGRTPIRVSRMDNVMKALLDIRAGRAFTRYWFDPIKHQIEVIVLANVDDTTVAKLVDTIMAESNGEIRRNGSWKDYMMPPKTGLIRYEVYGRTPRGEEEFIDAFDNKPDTVALVKALLQQPSRLYAIDVFGIDAWSGRRIHQATAKYGKAESGPLAEDINTRRNPLPNKTPFNDGEGFIAYPSELAEEYGYTQPNWGGPFNFKGSVIGFTGYDSEENLFFGTIDGVEFATVRPSFRGYVPEVVMSDAPVDKEKIIDFMDKWDNDTLTEDSNSRRNPVKIVNDMPVDTTQNFYSVIFRDAKRTKFDRDGKDRAIIRYPKNMGKGAETITGVKGAKVRAGLKNKQWLIQAVLIPRKEGIGPKKAVNLAQKVVEKIQPTTRRNPSGTQAKVKDFLRKEVKFKLDNGKMLKLDIDDIEALSSVPIDDMTVGDYALFDYEPITDKNSETHGYHLKSFEWWSQ